MTTRGGQEILVVACETSADRIAARALEAMEGVRAHGVGGERLAAAGAEILCHAKSLETVGLGGPAGTLGAWARAWTAVRDAIESRRPRVALLVDAPDFNLPLARVLSSRGTRVVFYVGPQVWAWRAGRLDLMRDRTDVVALVLPFEKAIYERAGVRAVFVGHPLLDEPPPAHRAATRAALGVGDAETMVALLPGSRRAEVARIAPPMIEAASLGTGTDRRFVFAPAPSAADPRVADSARAAGCVVPPVGIEARDILAASDAALIASGTATLEAALAGVPVVAVYRLGPLSWTAARWLVRSRSFALPNLVAGRRVVPEMLQGDVTGPSLARAVTDLLDPAERDRQRAAFDEVRERLGSPGAACRVAALVAERLG